MHKPLQADMSKSYSQTESYFQSFAITPFNLPHLSMPDWAKMANFPVSRLTSVGPKPKYGIGKNLCKESPGDKEYEIVKNQMIPMNSNGPYGLLKGKR